MELLELSLLLLVIAGTVTAIAKKLNIAYPIALVIVGALVGVTPISGLEELKAFAVKEGVFQFAIIFLFLPALLGEASFKMPFEKLFINKKPILLLAVLSTAISYLIVGFASMHWLGLSVQAAFTFAALMAATDPVSVISIFKSIGVNERLAVIMEGESLINDGLAYVLFIISSTMLLVYLDMGALGIGYGVLEFLKVVCGGLAIGGIFGYVFSKLTRMFDDYPLEILFSIILFYGSFIVAEAFHVSEVIAVVTAALILGNYGSKIGMSATTKLNLNSFWDTLALIANSIVFLMVGLEINRIDWISHTSSIVLAIIIVVVARTLAVYGSVGFVKEISWKWKHVFNWGGLRGSLSIALALSLPLDFPYREKMIVLAFSVVFFSLIVQGLTIKKLVQWLKINSDHPKLQAYEEYVARFQRYQVGINKLNRLKEQAILSPVLHEEMVQAYQEKMEKTRHDIDQLYQENPMLQAEEQLIAQNQMLYDEHEAIEDLEKREIISKQVAERHRLELIEKIEQNQSAIHELEEKM
ncbi:cation:proton antiporter [Hazenella sp. IB182357]|uniref:Cation:proton antiporter n=1 Tax=Polycladospora coralii TaxID=2771432 RepID=A0A926NDU2_9BACL|nr:cation:proton antiporter [Polycladospora coralii]MBD1371739.1 cation:proton antiporter [Polycladospora coralii]MBS7529206.1 cation:proton antiporter [Polycladospora coralii]